MFGRVAIFVYAVLSYLSFLGVFVYAVGFLGNFGTPTRLDGPLQGPLWQALLVNTGLLALFAVQHSVMARPAFKRLWTRVVPQPAERATYVLFSNLAMVAVFAFWQPMGGEIWMVTNPLGAGVLFGLFGLGWVILLISTFLVDHFDLFGLRQATLHLLGEPYRELPFKTRGFYRVVRHPIYVGWLLTFWATPTMTAAHLFFAFATTAYILIAIQLEERDLENHFGHTYRDYKRTVPALLPRFSSAKTQAGPARESV